MDRSFLLTVELVVKCIVAVRHTVERRTLVPSSLAPFHQPLRATPAFAARRQLRKRISVVTLDNVSISVVAPVAIVVDTVVPSVGCELSHRLLSDGNVKRMYNLRLTVPIRRIVLLGMLMQVERVGGGLLVLRRAPIAPLFLLAPSSIIALVAKLDSSRNIGPIRWARI